MVCFYTKPSVTSSNHVGTRFDDVTSGLLIVTHLSDTISVTCDVITIELAGNDTICIILVTKS